MVYVKYMLHTDFSKILLLPKEENLTDISTKEAISYSFDFIYKTQFFSEKICKVN